MLKTPQISPWYRPTDTLPISTIKAPGWIVSMLIGAFLFPGDWCDSESSTVWPNIPVCIDDGECWEPYNRPNHARRRDCFLTVVEDEDQYDWAPPKTEWPVDVALRPAKKNEDGSVLYVKVKGSDGSVVVPKATLHWSKQSGDTKLFYVRPVDGSGDRKILSPPAVVVRWKP